MAQVTKINPTTFELQDYNPQDENLISSVDINTILTENLLYLI